MKRSRVLATLGILAVAGTTIRTARAQMMDTGMMSGANDSAAHADMQTVMQLFAHHDAVRRRVVDIPGGIRAVTESDDPRITTLLQTHVAAMYQRIKAGRRFTMMSPTLPVLFDNPSGYRRVLSLMPHGVLVAETSTNEKLTAVLRAHAREVSGFVTDGMAAMMRGMMNH
jgi:hypothetical protein